VRIAVVGSGFAGAILARVARALGHEVTLLERGHHPRFAIGESSTPLAALALERLAARYGLADLHALAAYGRWRAALPDLRRGLKRGFTFYRHEPGLPYRNGPDNDRRLLVAASPDDAVADTHWLREDVDHHLVRRAAAEGVAYLDGAALDGVEERDGGAALRVQRQGETRTLQVDLVVDASGAAGAVAGRVGADDDTPPGLRTWLVYGHFEGVRTLREVAGAASFSPGPYPDERAAVHHLLDEGWMYELRFDHGVTSAGIVVEGDRDASGASPDTIFRGLLARYPSLEAQFADARPGRPIALLPGLQRQRARAAGARWALLPHTYMFWSPLFSTGIAWSLLGVERLGRILEDGASGLAPGLRRYAETLTGEGDHLQALVEAAYRARRDFDAFDAVSQVYFAAASYGEAVQRLCEPPAGTGGDWAWWGLLGATDPVVRSIVDRLARGDAPRTLEAAARLIAPRNVAGLADPARRRLYPVDLDALVGASAVLGLEPDDARARLSRLRAV